MAFKRLSPEVVALIHHVELNKSGWWNDVARRMILAVLLGNKADVAVPEIAAQILKRFQVQLLSDEVANLAQELFDTGKAIEKKPGSYAVSASTRNQYMGEAEAIRKLEERVRDYYHGILERFEIAARETSWSRFRDECLLPLLSQEGAEVLRLMDCDASSINNGLGQPGRLFFKNAGVDQEQLQRAVETFLSGDSTDVKLYLLHNLDAYFVLVASALSRSTIAAIARAQVSKPSTDIYVDTNYLFSILGWHAYSTETGRLFHAHADQPFHAMAIRSERSDALALPS